MGDGPSKVFLSYRRSDSAAEAAQLRDGLLALFRPGAVFLDNTSIPAGEDWERTISTELAASAVVVVLMGPDWLHAIDAAGSSRLHSPDDWVRREVETALNQPGTTVITVVLEETTVPSAEALPSTLAKLSALQAYRLRQQSWEKDLRGLMLRIHQLGRVPVRRPRLTDIDLIAGELGSTLDELEPYLIGAGFGFVGIAIAVAYALSVLGAGIAFIIVGLANVIAVAFFAAFAVASELGLFKHMGTLGPGSIAFVGYVTTELYVFGHLFIAPLAFLLVAVLLMWLTGLAPGIVLAASLGAELVAALAALATAEREKRASSTMAS